LEADGVTLVFNASGIAESRDNTGEYTIEVTGRNDIGLNLPIAALANDRLAVITDFGTIRISSDALQTIQALTGGTLRLTISRSSFQIALLASNTREVAYNDPANPLFISMPHPISDTAANGYVAVRRDASGNVIMPYCIHRNGEIIFLTPSTGTFDVIHNARTFKDVGQHWATPYITFVSARGLFGGYADGSFSPNTPMTRAMFAQVLANIEGIDLSVYRASRFTDVAAGAWYAPAVEWAALVGIVGGMGDGHFAPEASITREQMATMLANYISFKGYTLPPASQTTTAFNDEASIAPWARDAVKMMQAAGIISGRPGNIFDPQGTATRAEVATIFARFIEIYVSYAFSLDNGNTSTAAYQATATIDAYIDNGSD
jgi:hypothetical protein